MSSPGSAATPAETLDRFRAIITSTTAPSRHTPAYLGEVVVHAQDVRQTLGLVRTPAVDALTPVADFFARRDFTVASHAHAANLRLRAAGCRTSLPLTVLPEFGKMER